jgi:Arc/MetJ-type ribon-helix-helix transcriptional regulator
MPEAPSLEQFVEQQLQSGKYQSYEDMVQEGLRLLQKREQELTVLLRNCGLPLSDWHAVNRAFPLMRTTSSSVVWNA